jgi:hypothetical protein
MNFGNQGTGGIDDVQLTFAGLGPHRGSHAMGAENGTSARWDFVEFFYKNRASFAQLIHHMLVVNDLFPDVDWRPVEVESDLDDIDSSHHTGAKASRLEQEYFLVRAKIRCERLKWHNRG